MLKEKVYEIVRCVPGILIFGTIVDALLDGILGSLKANFDNGLSLLFQTFQFNAFAMSKQLDISQKEKGTKKGFNSKYEEKQEKYKSYKLTRY